MKKYWFALLALNLLLACSDKKESEEVSVPSPIETKQISLMQTPQSDFADKIFSFQKEKLTDKCEDDSEFVCAINQTINCTIDPKRDECDKTLMPDFIFMEDESLNRPTMVEYKIIELKPLANGQIEIMTESKCDGTWFGLCNGKVIYVMEQVSGRWHVKDIYARSKN